MNPEASSYTFHPVLRKKTPAFRRKLVRDILCEVQDGKCFWCGWKMKLGWVPLKGHHSREATLEHLQPKANGGRDTIINSVVACRKCNRDRQNRMENPVTGELISMPIDFGRRLKAQAEKSIQLLLEEFVR